VVLGVGNRLRGDDAIGSLVTDKLGKFEGLMVIDCATTPENYIEPVVRLAPERILIVDACDFGGKPGEFRLFEREDIERLAAGLLSTHTLPLSMTVALLEQQLKTRIQLLGVQPERIDFGEKLSEPVAESTPALVRFITDWAE